jgi:hypothetical protein
MTTSLKTFGYTYSFGGKSFAFHIVAYSLMEAKERLAAMANAKLEGQLIPQNERTDHAIPDSISPQ